MEKLVTRKKKEIEEPLSDSWFDKASEAARRFNLPIPEEATETEETERRLRQFEQEDGE